MFISKSILKTEVKHLRVYLISIRTLHYVKTYIYRKIKP